MLGTRRKLGVPMVVLMLVVASSGLAMAQAPVTVRLEPMAGTAVSGTVTLTPQGNGTKIRLNVAGLPVGSAARATIQAGTCAAPGASAAALPDLTADTSGTARANGNVLFRGTEHVALAAIADGAHTIAVLDADGIVACGAIPQLTTAAASAGLPATGGPTAWLLTALSAGAGLLIAGAALRFHRGRDVPGPGGSAST